ncbi:putative cytochrome p450 monooxygenase protein [Neofusicoccum parvum UCRNP2]|uniref:Putative cytochrome p450 monooxygenase protein n=1 Tax=Botryosphaeria parva (strain UCR-NP2) TaxID=1287680 RepID=R1ECD0_BOTPV|nr:putative cytochrome p450 monooxygenase protein [Neofusicoccum parvum UCRNP2]
MTVLPPSTPQGGIEPTLSLPPLRTLLWATTALLLLIHVLQTLRTAYLTPLRRVPGPWYAALTHLPLKYATLRGRRLHHIHALHGRHGPLVRVAPTELAAAAPADFRAVHRVGGGFVKAEWYGRFRNSAIDDVFSLRDARAHAARRRMLARAFGKGALRAAWEGVVRRRVERAVGRWLRLPGLRYFAEASERFMNYANVAVANARAGNIGTSNIFNAVLAEHEKDAAAMDDMTIKCEAVGLIAAGSGTTAVTLTYLVWAVLSRPDLQKRLEDEVGALEELSDVQLEELPLLNAIIDESLRVYGAAPGSLPRVVPEGGATLSGYYVPAGTTV